MSKTRIFKPEMRSIVSFHVETNKKVREGEQGADLRCIVHVSEDEICNPQMKLKGEG